jgi:hypothetical protein
LSLQAGADAIPHNFLTEEDPMDRPKRTSTASISHAGLNRGAYSLFNLGCFRDHLVTEKAPKVCEFGQATSFRDDVIQPHWLYAFRAIWCGFDGHAQKVGATSWLSAWPHAAQR